MTVMSLSDVNALPVDAFVARFGDVAEHSPWVATQAATARPFASRAAMIDAFHAAVAAAAPPERLALVRAHPDLAGKAALAGALTDDSRREQAGAGLDSLTTEEMARFTRLNGAYLDKFGFPFIFAVKGATKHMILEAFVTRLDNDAAAELATALAQIARIIRFRLEDRVAP